MYIRSDTPVPEVPPFYSGVTIPSRGSADGTEIDRSDTDTQGGDCRGENGSKPSEPEKAEPLADRAAVPPDVSQLLRNAPIPSVSDFEDVIPRFKRAPLESAPPNTAPPPTPKPKPTAPPKLPSNLGDIELDRLLVAAILIMLIAENGFDLSDDLPLILGILAIL